MDASNFNAYLNSIHADSVSNTVTAFKQPHLQLQHQSLSTLVQTNMLLFTCLDAKIKPNTLQHRTTKTKTTQPTENKLSTKSAKTISRSTSKSIANSTSSPKQQSVDAQTEAQT